MIEIEQYRRPTVAVIGAGVAGMTAAHELAERGFDVDVYERHPIVGGKCRSWHIPDTGTDGRADLPGEMGPHVFLAGYPHLGDTFARIPLRDGGSVIDNLTLGPSDSTFDYLWDGTGVSLPLNVRPGSILRNLTSRASWRRGFFRKLTAKDRRLLVSKLLALLTSGTDRQLGELDGLSVPEYVRAEELSDNGRHLLEFAMQVNSIPASTCGARGMVRGYWLYAALDPFLRGRFGPGWRLAGAVTNGPPNVAIFDPWAEYLRGLGVRFHLGHRATQISMADGKIERVEARDAAGADIAIEADYYILATPHDKAAELFNEDVVAADPALGEVKAIDNSYLGFMQVYLRRPIRFGGAFGLVGQPWVLGYFSSKLWDGDIAASYGDGTVCEIISIDCAAWHTPGIIYGKPALECSAEEMFEEARAQMRAASGDPSLLPDEDIHSYEMCAALSWDAAGRAIHDEPLWAQTDGSFHHRPDAVTRIPNLFLAASYVRTTSGRDCMDSANEAGRGAANGVLASEGVVAKPAFAGSEPPRIIQWLWRLDDRRYRKGLRNVFDRVVPPSSASLVAAEPGEPEVREAGLVTSGR